DRLRAVMLHAPRTKLPALPVPLVQVTAVGTTTVAVPNLVFVRRTAFESGEAALGCARLTVRRTQCALRFLIECCHRRAFLELLGSGKRRRLKSSEVWTGLELGVAPERIPGFNATPGAAGDRSGCHRASFWRKLSARSAAGGGTHATVLGPAHVDASGSPIQRSAGL